MNGIYTTLILDQRRIKKSGKFPVKLRITFERKQRYYPTPYNLSPEEFNKVMFGKKLTQADKLLKSQITSFEIKASGIIDKIPFFSWIAFEKEFFNNRAAKETIYEAFSEYSLRLKSDGRIGTAASYDCAQQSLEKFLPGARFSDITPETLRNYEKWMLSKNRSITTVGIYLRALRTLFNEAIEEGLLTRDLYPFGKRRFEIPTGKNIKKAMSLEEIAKIYHYQAPFGSTTERAKAYWMFLYLCNGINVKDLCLLKYENIQGDMLVFVRAKTALTKRVVEPIRAFINSDLKQIIEKFGNPDRSKGNFIFPVLVEGLSPIQTRNLIMLLTRVINNHMRKIAGELGIQSDVTTYVARHSFATILQRSGASTEFIGEALGHGNIKTTQNYLAGFEDENKRKVMEALTSFKS